MKKKISKKCDSCPRQAMYYIECNATNLKTKKEENVYCRQLCEGIVARPKVELFTKKGDRIITKVKYFDFHKK